MFRSIRSFAMFLAMMLPASMSMAAQHQIGFKLWNNNVPPIVADPNSPLGQANIAFIAKYGAESGFLGTSVGTRGELLVLVSDVISMNRIWRKMIESGNAVAGPNGTGFFIYPDQNQPPQPTPGYQYLGKLNIAERSTGRFILSNGTPEIKSFLVLMEENCTLARGSVEVAIPGTIVQPTQLVKTSREGSYTIAYEHMVNGGRGALLQAIDVAVGAVGGPIIVDICPVSIYVRF